MDLRHLRYFLAVAEEGHFGRAAERLHIVQPALSMQIKALEKEVGGPLFVRTSRKVELTEAGTLLRAEARRILEQADDALEAVRRSVNGQIGTVRVGYIGSAVISGRLIRDLRHFHKACPDAELKMRELPPQAQIDALLAGELDVGYSSAYREALPPELVGELTEEWPLLVALCADHPLADAARVDLAGLANEPLILYTGRDEFILHALHETLSHAPNTVHSSANALGMLAFAAAGLGIAIVPEPFARIGMPGLAYKPTDRPDVRAGLWRFSRADETSGAVNAYLRIAREAE